MLFGFPFEHIDEIIMLGASDKVYFTKLLIKLSNFIEDFP
jgi:hypothetical protein